jgi:DNA-binding MurR/RpiR family transcriptional regulator
MLKPGAKVAQKLESSYETLTPRLRKAARYVQKNPTEVALYPLRQVASDAKVSPTTLVRLAADLGFPTYNEFRNAFREGIRTGAEQYASNASRVIADRASKGFEATYEHARALFSGSLDALFRSVSVNDIVKASATLHRAATIYLLGMRPMFSASFYFAYVLKTFRDRIVLIEDRMGMMIDEIGPMSKRDALLVVSFEPYALSAVKAAEHARAVGASVIAITDHTLSPFSSRSTQMLTVPTSSTSFYQSLVPTLALIEMIVAHLLQLEGPAAVDRISSEYVRREQFGIYWSDADH